VEKGNAYKFENYKVSDTTFDSFKAHKKFSCVPGPGFTLPIPDSSRLDSIIKVNECGL